MKCYTNLRNIEKRGTTSNFSLSQWPLTCFIERCICFWKNPGRKKKKQCGRPSINDKVIWTRESICKIMESFSGLSRLCHDSIDVADNPHKDLCVCKICMRLLHKPVLLNNCQHLFCATCIFPYIIGKLETETKCTICFSNITLGSILKATSMQNILDNLFIKCCNNTCKEKFTVKNICFKEEHEKTCKVRNKSQYSSPSSSSSLTVTEIYKINEHCEIPKELDYAFAHFAKLKMARNKLHSFELPSGGPRAIQFKVTPKIYKTSNSISQKTIKRRQNQINQSLVENEGPAKKAKINQAALMLNSFNNNDKINILKKQTSPKFR
ncbi:uncharacterized protein LOC136096932 [Hydra vulgaris]|uniref:uncharacterized protein LOC136096932 n=1 Tax=Hydra vulgaris TaxID=6087 RepID=UPI0032E9F09C